jgi:hypothetical protein
MPAWRQKSPFSAKYERSIVIFAYKPGYRWPYPKVKYGVYPTDKLIVSREPANERLKFLADVARETLCFQARESVKALLPLQKAVLEEARSLAKSESDPVVQYLQDKIAQTDTKVSEMRDPSKGLNETQKIP